MIQSFRHKGLKLLFKTGSGGECSRRMPTSSNAFLRVSRKRPRPATWTCPAFRLHPLKGDLALYSVTVSANWRVVFRFEGGHARDVDFIDYHKEDRTMAMKDPPHPGLSVRNDCLGPLGLSVTEAAKRLGVSRKQLSDIVNCHAGISPEMAIRLDKAFGGGANTWLRVQAAYDLAKAMKRADRIKVARLTPAA